MRAPRGIFASAEEGEWLRARYLDDHKSIRQIAHERNCGYTTVWHALERHEIPRRGRGSGTTSKAASDGVRAYWRTRQTTRTGSSGGK